RPTELRTGSRHRLRGGESIFDDPWSVGCSGRGFFVALGWAAWEGRMSMLHATELLGGEAYDVHGNFVGKVTELYIEPADQPNRVARFLLSRGKYLPLVARHDQVSFVAPGVIKLNVEEKNLEHFEPNEGWLSVRKDLLDQQIIDTRGRKVVRVNDVDMAEHRTNGTVELRLTDVDVGLTGATRRLLQGLASPGVIRSIQD